MFLSFERFVESVTAKDNRMKWCWLSAMNSLGEKELQGATKSNTSQIEDSV